MKKRYEYVIAGLDCDGIGEEFAKFIEENYQNISIEYKPRQSGGTILYDNELGEICDETSEFTANSIWEEFCGQ